MKSIRRSVVLLAVPLLCGFPAMPQTPLSKPLAEFDKLVSQLKVSSLVGEPIRVGETAVVPFARLQFGVGGAEISAGFGGGMGAKTIPLGVLIVEGDDVRAELFPQAPEKPSLLQQVLQGILDRKYLFMVNGINLGNAPGNVQDLTPLVSAMMTGQTTVMVQALNLGNLQAAPALKPSAATSSTGELAKMFDAKQYAEALASADALLAKDAKNPSLHAWRGRILSRLGQTDAAIAEFQTAITIKPSADEYCYLGEALMAKGSKEQAAAAYRKALELKPDEAAAVKALAAMK